MSTCRLAWVVDIIDEIIARYPKNICIHMKQLPDDIIHTIMNYYELFQRIEACERLSSFKSSFAMEWALIMLDIQSHTPRYKITARTYSDTTLTLSVYIPDCDFRGFISLARFNAYSLSCCRKVYNIDPIYPSYYRLRNDIIYPVNLF